MRNCTNFHGLTSKISSVAVEGPSSENKMQLALFSRQYNLFFHELQSPPQNLITPITNIDLLCHEKK